MIYQKFPPNKDLENYIECYYVWESGASNYEPIEVESPPNSFTSIVFNYADSYSVSMYGGVKKETPTQFIIGQQTYSYKLHLSGKIGMAGIVFKPTGLASLFNIPMYVLTRERINLQVFIERTKINEVMNSLIYSSTAEEKFKILENFVLIYYYANTPQFESIDIAANDILNKNGVVNIDELSKNCFMSRRQFERKFLNKVGLSPKYYARLRRIGHICSQMAGKEKVNWQELYLGNNFYDQSHFIKDFIEFTGRSPEKYFYSNVELIHHLKEG